MTPRDLIEAFETLADTPDGVKRLRELVLHLAVRGKLVPQSPDDEPAHTLLMRIAPKIEQVLAATGIRRMSVAQSEAAVDVPFSTPAGWVWCRLSELAHPQAGFAFNAAAFNTVSHGMPLIRIRDIGQASTEAFYSGEYREEFLVRHGDYLVGMDGNFNIRCWRGPSALLNQRVTRLIFYSEEIEKKLICYSLQERINDLQGIKAYTTVQHLSGKQIAECLVPLPPLAEQHRIVARVDELMGLLDRLEAARAVRDEVRRAARDAALASLRAAEDAEAVQRAWTRISSQMDALFIAPEDVALLRQTIRQLAIRGRLVPQSPSDNAASKAVLESQELLASQPSVRGRTATNQQIRGDAALSVGEWGPRVVPEGWIEIPLSAVTRLESGHTPDRAISHYWDGDFFWIGIQDARRHRGRTIYETERRITQAGLDNSAARLLPAGTVCLSRTASVGYTVIMGATMCTSQDFVNFVCTAALAPRYLQLVLEGEHAALKRFAKGAVHLTIYFPEVKAFHMLLPPVFEQHSIIAKVDSLMAICDGLEARLAIARDVQVRFAAAAVHHLDV